MSATMPNLRLVADWLGAALFATSYRPVELREYVKVRTYGCTGIAAVRHLRLYDHVRQPTHVHTQTGCRAPCA